MVKISEAELEVMKVIWKRKKTTSVEIIEDLKDIHWNFNTIRTLIKRLLVKGAIEVVKKEGKTYTYKAVVTESEYRAEVARNMVKKLYNNSLSEFVLQYCESVALSIKEIKELGRQINEMIARKEGKQ